MRRGTASRLGWTPLTVVFFMHLGAVARAQPAPVDLLHAVPSTITVSSAYRNDATQVARLVDGDPATAWNSRSGDLVGAFIEIRLPDDVEVSSIRMTAGFTRINGERDLFTGNYRVVAVNVTHAGTSTRHELDADIRDLQTLPVTGAGGAYRIELTGFFEGDREDWHEACISELQVLGRSSVAQPGAHAPTTAVAPRQRAIPGGVYYAVDHFGVRLVTGGRFSEVVSGGDAYLDIEVTRGGVVYILTSERGLLQVRGGRARPMPRLPGSASARAISLDHEDGLVVLTDRGLLRLRGRRWVALGGDLSVGGESGFSHLSIDGHGVIWLLHRLQGVYRLRGDTLEPMAIPGARGEYRGLVAGRDGTIGVIQRRAAHRWHDDVWRSVSDPVGRGRLDAVAVQPDGTLLVGGRDGLVAFAGEGEVRRIPLPDSRSYGGIEGLACDGAGNIWASVGNGIVALSSTFDFLRYYRTGYVPLLDGRPDVLVVRGDGPFL